MRRGVGARGQLSREHGEPCADRGEAEELEACQGDHSGREQHHSGGEQHHDQRRHAAEAAGEARDAEAPGHDPEQREAEARRRDIVHDRADRDRDEADDHEVQTGRDHRRAEASRDAAADRGRQEGDDEDAVRGEEEARHDGGRVEDVGREVVESAELREVQLPPQRVACGEHGDHHAGGEGSHGTVAEVVRVVPVSRLLGRGHGGDRNDALAFGICEEGQRTHVLCVRRYSEHADPPSRTPRRSSRLTRTLIPRSRMNRWAYNTAPRLRTYKVCGIRASLFTGRPDTICWSALDTAPSRGWVCES